MIRKPSLTKQNDKVLIVAYGESMNRTPWTDTSFDLYTLNAAHRFRDEQSRSRERYASLWFQMHRPGSGEGHIDDPDHVEWLKLWAGCPVLMVQHYPEFPASVSFPLEEVTRDAGPGKHFYTSSIDYMVAYAIHQQYKEIHLYGVDMLADDYQARKHSLAWYLGVAATRGIALSIPPESGMLKHTHIYGYEQAPQEYKKIIGHLEEQIGVTAKERKKATDEQDQAWGRAREQDGMRKAYQNIIDILKLRENGSTY